MATNRTKDTGIIILGNAGSGKSFLCNILIGSQRFKAAFRTRAVTLETEHHRIRAEGINFRIYNIPGLIEIDRDGINRNKREIMRAFDECSNSIVLFVWSNVGGRVQQDDVIAFKALNEAYQFPQNSLGFVVNNLPPEREDDYDGEFTAEVVELLTPLEFFVEDFVFVDKLDSNKEESKDKFKQARFQLLNLILSHKPTEQKKHTDIKLEADKINELRLEVQSQQEQARKDRDRFEEKIDKMTKEIKKAKDKARSKIEDLKEKLSDLEDEDEEKSDEIKKLRKEIKALKAK
ncbi:unnamed protein product [Didymodactylos carnosus]|uniref:AIG1-type G domain-containing protein n=1 Tax=Didymodactylos carnosus TaxID=1234261 RepID=A0A8S2D166_9BILA|nr:unnamed protein product [Didymodactylos carnosus]CAF3638675.1 unnamed protein product [Didymodactylos carnosus]